MEAHMMLIIFTIATLIAVISAGDGNEVFDPCSDAKVAEGDGFTFGIAFSTKEAFSLDQIQYSPCDSRLGFSGKSAQLAIFRPMVDEISLLTINSSNFNPVLVEGYMVAFAGRKYAARSFPIMVADNANTITSYTLVLEFQQGTLQNLYWKSFGCDSCAGVCLNMQDCAVPNSKCKSNGGSVDCDIRIQLTFSGTDKNLEALNSWYEVNNLRRFSLYGLYSSI